MVLALWSGLAAPTAVAGPALCDAAARQAAAETGVPADLLLAITLAETGRTHNGRLQPWPWAANLEGRGHWFDSREALSAFAERSVAAGRTSIDIGCFQINWRWHGQHFDRPADLSDPLTGARHAARYLAALHREFGTWERATGAYHSRTPHLAARYGARVAALRAQARTGSAPQAPAPVSATTVTAAMRPAPGTARTGWTMPAAGAPPALASLVPQGTAPRPFLTGLAP
jgi:hypothetical protein